MKPDRKAAPGAASRPRPAAVVLAFALFLTCQAPAEASDPPPDVLFIVLDDLNDWVGVLGGNPQARTPNIDRLAARGMVFTNAHTVATSCLPSRAAMLTGISPFNSGVYDQSGDWRDVELLRSVATLPQFFRESDYTSVGAGKIFHAHTYRAAGYPGQQDEDAWDAFYPSFERQLNDEVRPHDAPTNGNPLVVEATEGGEVDVHWLHTGFDWSPVIVDDRAMGDGQVVAWIEEQLLAETAGPRFVAAGIYRPHLPWYVPPAYFDLHPSGGIVVPDVPDDDIDDLPAAAPFQDMPHGPLTPTGQHEWVVENGLWQEAVRGYLASISFADAMVGRIIDALDRSGRAADTVVVLVSDHGFHLGEKKR
ncbi:MAG TPA: sulfatase-like hydrolase/transferase, partial [Woeseiaceae bacterium]|nr:sulfatase-like hydrolase/transferase [Woeseiaceae bacterium]